MPLMHPTIVLANGEVQYPMLADGRGKALCIRREAAQIGVGFQSRPYRSTTYPHSTAHSVMVRMSPN
jgi:hypothetical protein